MAYTDEQIAAALTAPARRWSFRYDRITGQTGIHPLEVTACSVSYNDLADGVQRTCKVAMPAGETFDPLTDLLRPWARLLMPDGGWQEWPLGTFLLSGSARQRATAAGGGAIEYDGWDRAVQNLEDDKTLDRYVVASGAVVLDTVRSIVAGRNLSTSAIPAGGPSLPAALEWEPGTSWRKIVNDLLAAINYRPVTGTPLGSPTTQPYLTPDAAPVVWEYLLDPSSVVRRGIETTLDLYGIPNVWVASVSEPDRAPLRSVYVNDSPDDPLSTVRRGRKVVEVVEPGEVQAVDQATLDAFVARRAQAARSAYEQAAFSTGLMPFHEGGDVVMLDYGDGPLRFKSHTWEMDLRAGGAMRHTMRRVVTL